MTNAEVERPLPPGVRKKVVSLAARALSAMPPEQIPPALRRAANFAPARRARLAGAQLAAAVESDENFRSHLAVQVRALVPQLVNAVEDGTSITPDRAVEVAAVAYLVRPPGWERVLDSINDAEPAGGSSSDELSQTVQRLTAALLGARGEVKVVRERLRGQLDEMKADNAQLRRSLGAVRQQLRSAETAAATADEAATDGRQNATAAARTAEAEARRLRSRIADLEGQVVAARRASRDARDINAMRLRLLVDTLVDAAAGLRRSWRCHQLISTGRHGDRSRAS